MGNGTPAEGMECQMARQKEEKFGQAEQDSAWNTCPVFPIGRGPGSNTQRAVTVGHHSASQGKRFLPMRLLSPPIPALEKPEVATREDSANSGPPPCLLQILSLKEE